MIARRVWISVLFCLPVLIAVGCGKDKKKVTAPTSEYLSATSPANVLANLKRAYEKQNGAEYRKLFDVASFQFEFADRDRQNDPNIPASWGFVEEVTSADNLFADPTVQEIVLAFSAPDPVAATEQDQLPGGPEGAWKVTLQNVHLEVHTQDESGPLEYLVERDGAEFFFRQFPDDPIDGQPSWKVFLWRDKPAGGLLATESKTWGSIKNLYN